MKYKPFKDLEEFFKEIASIIDSARLVYAISSPLPKVKGKTIKTILNNNLEYLLPHSLIQVDSCINLSFTRYDIKLIGQIDSFWFIGLNVYSGLLAPVFICIYLNNEGQLCFYTPTSGNTFNVLTNKPLGNDKTDEISCNKILNCTFEEFCKNPLKHQNLELIKRDICENFNLSEYSVLTKHSLLTNVENWVEFTEKISKSF